MQEFLLTQGDSKRLTIYQTNVSCQDRFFSNLSISERFGNESLQLDGKLHSLLKRREEREKHEKEADF